MPETRRWNGRWLVRRTVNRVTYNQPGNGPAVLPQDRDGVGAVGDEDNPSPDSLGSINRTSPTAAHAASDKIESTVGQAGDGHPGAGQQGADQPEASQPGPSQQGDSQPGAGQRGTGQQRAGQQRASQPGASQPGASQQGDSQPRAGRPGAGRTGASQQGDSQPGAGRPGAGRTGASQPGVSRPGASQQGDSQPGVGRPGAGQPGACQPGAGRTGDGQRGAVQQGAGRPGGGHSKAGRPAAGEMAGMSSFPDETEWRRVYGGLCPEGRQEVYRRLQGRLVTARRVRRWHTFLHIHLGLPHWSELTLPRPVGLALLHAVLTFACLSLLPRHPLSIPTALGLAGSLVLYWQVLWPPAPLIKAETVPTGRDQDVHSNSNGS